MHLLRHILPTALIALALLLAWQVYCMASDISALVLPAPSDVLRSLVIERARLGPHVLATIQVAGSQGRVSELGNGRSGRLWSGPTLPPVSDIAAHQEWRPPDINPGKSISVMFGRNT